MVYRVALCDDNKAFLSQLEEEVNQYCRKHQIDARIQSFDDSDSLLEMIEEKRMHEIYILDIQMNPSGMTLVDEIHKISDTPYIILLTAFEEYAIEACGKGVFSYILKEEAYTQLSVISESEEAGGGSVLCY